MPVESLPWSIQGQSHPATVARNATAAMLGAPAAAVSPAAQILTAGGSHGVVSAGDLAVTQNGTPNMSVNVAAGRAFIRGTETASLSQGVYGFFNDGTVNLTVAASDPTNPRRDLVVAQVRDSNYAGGANDARLFVVTGTPAASPSDPTIPANCLVLARISVAALSTTVLNAAITDLRTRASSLGGTQVCTSTTRPSGASLYSGLGIYETDTNRLYVYNGASWVRVLAGSITSADIVDGTITSADIADGTIVNGDISGAAAIAYSKLNLAGSITSADIADGTITSADIADGTIVNGDINASAGITYGKLAAIPKVRLRRAANQAVGAGQTTINWDTEDADTDGFITVASNTITIPAGLGGMYSICGRIVSSTAFPANSYIVVTAAGVAYAYHIPSAGTQNNGAYAVTCLLNASATVEVACFLSSGSSNFTGNLEMCRLGA